MSELQTKVVELEMKAADCELMGSLSADPELRFKSRTRAAELRERARELRAALERHAP